MITKIVLAISFEELNKTQVATEGLFVATMFPTNLEADKALETLKLKEIRDRLVEVLNSHRLFEGWRKRNVKRDQLQSFSDWAREALDASTEARVIFFSNLKLYADVLGVSESRAGLLMNLRLGEIFSNYCDCQDCAKLRELFPQVLAQIEQRN